MTKNKESFGFLTKKMTEFLNLTHEQRKIKYGSGVYKMYQRIVDNTIESFNNLEFVQHQLLGDKEAKKYLGNIEFNEKYKRMHGHFKQIEYTENPKSILKSTIQNLNSVQAEVVESSDLKNFARPDFQLVHNWLVYFKSKIEPEKEEGAKL